MRNHNAINVSEKLSLRFELKEGAIYVDERFIAHMLRGQNYRNAFEAFKAKSIDFVSDKGHASVMEIDREPAKLAESLLSAMKKLQVWSKLITPACRWMALRSEMPA